MVWSNRITGTRDIGRIATVSAIVIAFAAISINPEITMPVWMTTSFIFITIMFYMSTLAFSIIPLPVPIVETDIGNIPILKHLGGVLGGMVVSCSTCTAFLMFNLSWEIMVLSIMFSPAAHKKFRSSIAAYFRLLWVDIILRIHYRHSTNHSVILLCINNLLLVYSFLLILFLIYWSQLEPPLEWEEQPKVFLNVIYEIKFKIHYIR